MLLEMKGICKSFHGANALTNVDLSIRPGEIHGLVGENGAGKSTLIKILTGVYTMDSGQILLEGRPLSVRNPLESMEAGIRVIHQDRTLVPSFTALENIWLGQPYPTKLGRIDWKAMRREVQQAMETLGLQIELDSPAFLLSPPQQTCVEIVRAMMRDCRLLILDEPTAALTDRESEKLFRLLFRLREKGTAILYISHRLDEIFRLTDRITVLKNGERVCTKETASLTKAALISAMTDDWQSGSLQRSLRQGEILLQAEHIVSEDGIVRDGTLTAHAGEILGLFGLGGSGRTELLECIYGLRPLASGEVTLCGRALRRPCPADSIRQRTALISEDRRGKALIESLSVRDNVCLGSLGEFATCGVVSDRRRNASVDAMTSRLEVRMATPKQPVSELSGGNQQKVVFAGALLRSPRVFLCDEPTQAVDVRTRHEIHQLLRKEADAGGAVVFVSSDLSELLEVADRIQVMARGRTKELLENVSLSTRDVLSLCYLEET